MRMPEKKKVSHLFVRVATFEILKPLSLYGFLSTVSTKKNLDLLRDRRKTSNTGTSQRKQSNTGKVMFPLPLYSFLTPSCVCIDDKDN